MKQNWTYKKLGEVCEIICGQDYKAIQDDNGLFPIYGTGGIIGHATQHRCPANSVIIGRKGSINNPIFVEEPFWNVDTAFGVVPNANFLVPKYFFFFCKNYDFTKHDVSVTIPSLRRTDIIKIIIPVPPLPEQHRIVSELNLLQSIIDKQQAQLKELDTLAQSVFYDMFGDPVENEKGWETSTLLEISKGKLTYGSGASAIEFDGETRYIRITDIEDNGSLKDECVSPSEINPKYYLNDGDILFARSGATVGKTYQHKKSNGKCIYAGYLIRLIPNRELVLPEYVFGFTKTTYYKSFVGLAQKAVAQPNINAEQYGNLIICLPPLSLQQSFAAKIESIEKQKAAISKSIAETEKLFEYTMDKYFG